MKPIKVLTIAIFLAGFTLGIANAGDKYYVPSWGMQTGDITKFPKSHQATTDYTPNLVVNYDKQHMPWFESTLKPQNLRKEGQKDLLEEVGKWIFGGSKS